MRDKSNSHFATLVKSGEVLDRNETKRGDIKNFNFHKMRAVAAYFFLFDKTFFSDEPTSQTSSDSVTQTSSSENIDTTSLQGSGFDTTSVDKEELRLLKYMSGKKKTGAPKVSVPKVNATPKVSAPKVSTAPKTTVKQEVRAPPQTTTETTVKSNTETTKTTSTSTSTSVVSPRSVVEESTDDMGLIGDSDEKARREEERMRKTMGFVPSSAPTTSTNNVSKNDTKEYPIPTTAQIGTVYEASLWSELNRARNEPKEFAKYLEEMKPRFEGTKYQIPGKKNVIKQTVEGVQAVEEAIKFLQTVAPQKALRLSTGLSQSSQDFVKLIANVKNFEGIETNEKATERLSRYGKWSGKLLQNIALGDVSPTEAVASWIIDDGNKNRDHRTAIFSDDVEFAGVASGPHVELTRCIVVSLVEQYREGADEPKPTVVESADDDVPQVKEDTKYVIGKIEPHDGYYSLNISNLGCPIKSIKLELLKNGTEIYFLRKVRVGNTLKESAERWKLPFSISSKIGRTHV